MKKILLIIILSFTLFESVIGQGNNNKGKDFWVTPLNAYSAGNGYGIIARIQITSERSISGTVSTTNGWSASFNSPANSKTIVNVMGNYSSVPYVDGITKNGIHIITSDSAWVTVISDQDVTSVFPVPSLSNEYIVNSYAEGSYWVDQFAVLALFENSRIEIIPPDSASFVIYLNKGEVYNKFGSVNSSGRKYVSGYRVKLLTCGKIAVFAGSPCSSVNEGTCSSLYEQMQPLYSLGKEFIAVSVVPIKQQYNNLYYNHAFYSIVAIADNTTINLNGNIFTLNNGDTYRGNIYDDLYLKADKPVSVAQFGGGRPLPGDPSDNLRSDPYMTMVSPVDQQIYDGDIHNRHHNNNFNIPFPYVIIVVKTSNKTNVYIDGQKISPDLFSSNINNPSYCFAQVPLNIHSSNYHIHSSGGFTAYYFEGSSEPIGYTLGFGYTLPLIEQQPSFSLTYAGSTKRYTDFNQVVCSCEPIVLSVDNPFSELIYKWKLTDTTYAYGKTISHHYLNGDYKITLYALTKDGCLLNQVTMEHLIVENCDITMSPNQVACAEDTTILTVNAGSTFLWNTGERTQAIKVSPDKTTLYAVSVDGGAADICDSIIVYVKGSKPVVDFGPSQTICEGATVILDASYDQANYVWQDKSTNSTYSVTKEGTYFVTATNPCGMDQDTIDIFVIYPPKVELGNNFGICLEQQRELCFNVEADNFKWSTGSTDSCITITQPGNYFISVSNRCFTRRDGVNVTHAVCKELVLYNLITPNKDGKNDFFVVENIDERDCTLSIFNRWGNKVYEKDHYNNEWNASGLSDGVYYYRLDDHTTGSVFKGWVEVLANTSK